MQSTNFPGSFPFIAARFIHSGTERKRPTVLSFHGIVKKLLRFPTKVKNRPLGVPPVSHNNCARRAATFERRPGRNSLEHYGLQMSLIYVVSPSNASHQRRGQWSVFLSLLWKTSSRKVWGLYRNERGKLGNRKCYPPLMLPFKPHSAGPSTESHAENTSAHTYTKRWHRGELLCVYHFLFSCAGSNYTSGWDDNTQ